MGHRKHAAESTYLSIEHLTLGRQPVTLLNKGVNLLATLQHTLDLKVYQHWVIQ